MVQPGGRVTVRLDLGTAAMGAAGGQLGRGKCAEEARGSKRGAELRSEAATC